MYNVKINKLVELSYKVLYDNYVPTDKDFQYPNTGVGLPREVFFENFLNNLRINDLVVFNNSRERLVSFKSFILNHLFKENNYSIGDEIYIKRKYLEHFRFKDELYLIKGYKFTMDRYNGELYLYGYTLGYGSGGHDVSLKDIDFERTDRMKALDYILK